MVQGHKNETRDAELKIFPGLYDFIIIIKDLITKVVQNTKKLNTAFFLKCFISNPFPSNQVAKYKDSFIFIGSFFGPIKNTILLTITFIGKSLKYWG